MKKRLLCLLLCLMLCPALAAAEERADFFVNAETEAFGKIIRTYDSSTLK